MIASQYQICNKKHHKIAVLKSCEFKVRDSSKFEWQVENAFIHKFFHNKNTNVD